MLDQEFHIARLIKAQLNNELDDVSAEQLQRWLDEQPDNLNFYKALTAPENFQRELIRFESIKSEDIWQRTQEKMAQKGSPALNIRAIQVRYRWLVGLAAAVTIFIAAGLWFYYQGRNSVAEPVTYANDVSPGKQGATLTLADGKKIRLNETPSGHITNQAGVVVSKTSSGQLVYTIKHDSKADMMNTLSTANGETYQLQLPDGSKVWLNAGSSLTYNSNFVHSPIRSVKLTGEGYFEVAKDKKHPFIVRSGAHEVEVLGTHFNINSYGDEPTIATTLLEGSVKVTWKNKTAVLKPGQRSKSNDAAGLTITDVDTNPYVAWKNNQFSFESEDIQTIMRMVERWYDVKVEYKGALTQEKFWGGVSRLDNVSKVLNVLELTGKVHFEIKGRTIYVFKSNRSPYN
ncbi:FecR domain-containing protein [Mucilaginibacter ximonensis]|uniref:FecR domain-containing protein n=1 Tax=Mucilaginibacter ximonensis TaxID=538021 RepID=A0ABW5YA85_9SPHI